ncbi:MAG TPA: NAD(P)H-binding protein [Rubrivivax sp.]|nr:NAD(P)H-binding protein [Pseudomonadota bacterium]HOW46033.1 NAD(P)H-binding protein [Rubrivivax sp.]HRY88838.1 NAD(P)H-binding protein [Rubrivivax sp.]
MARKFTVHKTAPRIDPIRTVLVAGATGLVGRELLTAWRAASPPPTVHALARRLPAAAAPGVHWHAVDYAALAPLPAATAACCALGTTIKTAGSQAAFRAVDFDAVLAFARAARAAGVRRFAVVSALGADAGSGVFYNRVKGEMEQALAALEFPCLVIARPSLLAGDRAAIGQPVRTGERLALAATAPLRALIPKAWRPIAAGTVARAIVRALQQGKLGTQVIASAELQELGA